MNSILDVIGSFVIGGLVILLLTQINSSIKTSNYEKEFDMLNQSRIITTNEIFKDDLYKLGYRVPGSKILSADSTTIKFCSDYDDDGTVDTIYYYLGNTGELSNTSNPSDKPLYRVFNHGQPIFEEAVTNFKMTFYDSSGTEINYTSLVNQTSRNLVRGIQLRIDCESAEKVEGNYESISWQQVVKPKNLM